MDGVFAVNRIATRTFSHVQNQLLVNLHTSHPDLTHAVHEKEKIMQKSGLLHKAPPRRQFQDY